MKDETTKWSLQNCQSRGKSYRILRTTPCASTRKPAHRSESFRRVEEPDMSCSSERCYIKGSARKILRRSPANMLPVLPAMFPPRSRASTKKTMTRQGSSNTLALLPASIYRTAIKPHTTSFTVFPRPPRFEIREGDCKDGILESGSQHGRRPLR